jgi:uncharacterized protein (TIGR00269 family)
MKCHCGRRAVYFRKYEGTHLCRDHFIVSVERKAKRTIRKYGMLSPGDRVAVALSGGKDSSSVLYILNKIIGPRKDMEMFAVSFNEGTGKYRDECVKRARKLCGELGVEHHVFSFKKELGKTLPEKLRKISSGIKEPCTYCGIGRRYLINKKSRELGATKICVGHNLDDEVQAALMNYIRGDMARAARMQPVTNYSMTKRKGEKFIPRIKPLRDIPERETALYAYLKGFDIYEGKCPFAGGVRFDAKDFINKMEDKYPGVKFSILETFDKLNPWMQKIAEKEGEIKLCRICGEPGAKDVCKTCELWK